MKKMKYAFVAMALFAFAACTQKPAESTSAASSADDEKAVAAITDSLTKLIITPDSAALTNLAAPQLTYVHSGGKYQNKEEFVSDLVHGAFDFLTVDISNQKIIMSGDVAVVRQDFHATATNAGVPAEVQIGNVLIWQKQDGQWKLLARQAFKIPPPAAPTTTPPVAVPAKK